MKKIVLVLVAPMVLVFTGCEKKETISMPFDVAASAKKCGYLRHIRQIKIYAVPVHRHFSHIGTGIPNPQFFLLFTNPRQLFRVYPDIDPVFPNTHSATSSSFRCVIGGMRPARSRSSDRKSTRLNSSHRLESRMPSSA